MTLTKTDDHVAEALDHLIQKFKGKERVAALITSYVEQIQDLEDALWGVLLGRQIDNAVGEQLDGLGSIVGEDRNGKTDDQYRIAIRTRILINASSGTAEDAIGILKAATGSVVKIREFFPAAFIAELTTPVDTGFDAALVAVYLREGKAAGVLAHLVYYPEDPFRFDTSGQGYDEGHYGGAE